ncbi:NAD-dependent epimerase/dehydratase family protein [Rhizobium sp. EC-SD404]|uniref:NAD-dependent epimerase/dehydratase family protein n=1 Tax=Rhizobium sp. EC-SD404 TaxID=2038389 RepID=UPI0012567C94|nr:NAD-dependent epimerase/dehydratase family protein [Rhizobium sp. EC-SD404]VVT24857.1 hypothetical protein RHIZ404_220418 [Rhizobium sp. EC-SD404]
MKIAITGAGGFIGDAAARCALARGHRLIRVVRPGSPPRNSSDMAVDLEDGGSLEAVAARVDAVVHCASSDDPAFLPVLQAASFALISGLPPGGRFAMQGGSAVFGDTGAEAVSDPFFDPPPNLQARAAFDQQILCSTRADVLTRIVYGSLIYGGSAAAIPSIMIRVAMETGVACYFGQGKQVWSSAHVLDVGALLIDAVENEAVHDARLFAAGRAVQLKPVADIIGQVLGVPSRPVRSEEEARMFGPFAELLTMNQHFSSETARTHFRWCPEMSDDVSAIVRALTRQASRTSL